MIVKICALLLLSYFIRPASAQTPQNILLFPSDTVYGNYLAIPPKSDTIKGVLVLFPGYCQRVESIFPETKLHIEAYNNHLLTIAFAPGSKLYVDSVTTVRLDALFKDVMKRWKVKPENFVLSGFSAGGLVAMRYTEMCNEHPELRPIKPTGVFTVDSPIDLFTLWDFFKETIAANFSEPAVSEAKNAMNIVNREYGNPENNIKLFSSMTPFCMNKAWGDNEKYLKNTAVRVYHDIDVAWRLVNRHQTVHNSNYEVTSELICRLLLLGNTRAEFIQSAKKGYRSNGMRHPHSWSIVDERECIQWVLKLFGS